LPVCLTDTPAERQPGGGVLDRQPVTIAPGERLTLTLGIDRNGIPKGEPLSLLYQGSESVPENVLSRTPDGILTVTGSRAPFLGNTTQMTLMASPDAKATGGPTVLRVGIKKVSSKFPTSDSGSLNIDVFVK